MEKIAVKLFHRQKLGEIYSVPRDVHLAFLPKIQDTWLILDRFNVLEVPTKAILNAVRSPCLGPHTIVVDRLQTCNRTSILCLLNESTQEKWFESMLTITINRNDFYTHGNVKLFLNLFGHL